MFDKVYVPDLKSLRLCAFCNYELTMMNVKNKEDLLLDLVNDSLYLIDNLDEIITLDEIHEISTDFVIHDYDGMYCKDEETLTQFMVTTTVAIFNNILKKELDKGTMQLGVNSSGNIVAFPTKKEYHD